MKISILSIALLIPGIATAEKLITYKNDVFNFTISLPEKWHIAGVKKQIDTTDAGGRALFGNNYKPETNPTTNTMLIFAFERLYKNQPAGMSIAITAQPKSLTPEVVTAHDYLEGAKAFMESGHIKFNIPDPITNVKLGNKTFSQLIAQQEMGKVTKTAGSYSLIESNTIISIGTTCFTESTCKEVSSYLQTINFK